LQRAQVDLKLAQDKNEEDLGKVQGEVDEWKNKFHAAEAKLTTATNQSNATLRTTQAELDDWKDKCLALEAELKIEAEKMRVDLETVQSEMETWKTRSLAAEVERDSAQTALRDATAQIPSDADTAKTDLAAWEAKATAWDAERKRHKNQTARNAALISQFQVDVPKLEAKLHDAESERDKLKETLQAENTQALAKNNALTAELEELKKMYAAQAAPTSPSKASSSIFIKRMCIVLNANSYGAEHMCVVARQQPLRTPLPEKPPSQTSPSSASPRVPASTIASPIALGALRRKSFSTPSASASSSSAPPPERTFLPAVAFLLMLNIDMVF
jgi:predicted  nucleic acid-binding Zn-ribbon protein